jgi:hypothetical protein
MDAGKYRISLIVCTYRINVPHTMDPSIDGTLKLQMISGTWLGVRRTTACCTGRG